MTINDFWTDQHSTVCNMQIILKTHLNIEWLIDGRFYNNNSFALTDQLELD